MAIDAIVDVFFLLVEVKRHLESDKLRTIHLYLTLKPAVDDNIQQTSRTF